MEKTFCDLRLKEVINQVDGKKLGRIIDMLIDTDSGKICGIIVPGEHCKSVFKRSEEIFIPWNKICKIGDDVILVKLGDNKKDDKDDHKHCDRCDRCDDRNRCDIDRCDNDCFDNCRDNHRDRCDRDKCNHRDKNQDRVKCMSLEDNDNIRIMDRE